jgi:hypothetical protein
MGIQERGTKVTSFRKTPTAAGLIVLLCGCFNPSTYTPIVSRVDSASGGGVQTGATVALVSGMFFAPGVIVYWNGTPVPTTYQTSSSLQIGLGPDQNRLAVTAEVTAVNEGGMLSDPCRVTVIDAPLTATGIDPAQATPGSGPLAVTVTGTGFTPASQVLWNGSGLVTTFNSSTSLTGAVPATLLANAGEAIVQVAPFLPCPVVTFCMRSQPLSFHLGTSTKTRVGVDAQDVVWDATHALLFVATESSTGAATVTALDPATGTFGVSKTLSNGPPPVRLTISAHDVFLYVVRPDANAPATRLSLPGLTDGIQVPANGSVGLMAAAPDAPETAAFHAFGSGVAVFDGTARRGQPFNQFLSSLAWGPNASTLYGVDYITGNLLSFPVDSMGVTAPTVLSGGGFYFGKMKYDRAAHLLYDDAGHVFDELGAAQAGFTIPDPCIGTMDGPGGRMFFVCSEFPAGATLRSYDLATRQLLSLVSLELPSPNQSSGVRYVPIALVRFGVNGLAAATFNPDIGNSIYLYSGAFVH